MDEQILDARTTVDVGAYHAWDLEARVRNASVTPVDDSYVFSYTFTVDRGPPVTLAVTTTEALQRRADRDGQYKEFTVTRSHGRRGAVSERISVNFLERFVVDHQYIGPATSTPDRLPATVHVQAYLSRPTESAAG